MIPTTVNFFVYAGIYYLGLAEKMRPLKTRFNLGQAENRIFELFYTLNEFYTLIFHINTVIFQIIFNFLIFYVFDIQPRSLD